MNDRSLAQTLALVFGIACLGARYGILVSSGGDASVVPANNADDWLHLLLAVGLLGSWWVAGRERPTTVATTV